jgi:hypothetical protein
MRRASVAIAVETAQVQSVIIDRRGLGSSSLCRQYRSGEIEHVPGAVSPALVRDNARCRDDHLLGDVHGNVDAAALAHRLQDGDNHVGTFDPRKMHNFAHDLFVARGHKQVQ